MAKSKKQKELTEQVQARLTTEVPLRVRGEAVATGGERGSTKSVDEIHPSLEGGLQRLVDAGLENGEITTSSGLNVRVTKGPRSSSHTPIGQGLAPQQGKTPLPPVLEGVSQRYVTDVGRNDRGPEAVARFTAEAHDIAQRPNPLRSDGLVDAVMALHTPSIGGNQIGHGGALVREARTPEGRDRVLNALGYSDEVQNKMLDTARRRVAENVERRRSGASQVEMERAAQGQVQEHLDEAIHGTRSLEHGDAITSEALTHEGMGLDPHGPGPGTERAARQSRGGKTGLGMTPPRSPAQQGMRDATRALVRGGQWRGLRDADALSTASQNLTDLLTAQQKARRASQPHPSEMNTMSPGSDPEGAFHRNAQPVFSTSNPGVGVMQTKRGQRVQAPTAVPGAVSPVPPNLPSGPATPHSVMAPEPLGPEVPGRIRPIGLNRGRSYAKDIEAYEARRAAVPAPKNPPGTKTRSPKPQPASNVSVAQTEPSGIFHPAGMDAARQQDVRLGNRPAQGQYMAAPRVR